MGEFDTKRNENIHVLQKFKHSKRMNAGMDAKENDWDCVLLCISLIFISTSMESNQYIWFLINSDNKC